MKKTLTFLFGLLIYITTTNAQQTVGLFQNDSLSFNGYTLFAPLRSDNTYLIDNCGKVVNTWTSNYDPGNAVYLMENGNLLRTGKINGNFGGGGVGGLIEIRDWNNNLIWSYQYTSNTYHQHHDVEPLPNGNILILAWESKTSTEAIAAGRNPNNINNSIWPEKIVEIQPIGTNQINIVWEWHLWDHLVQDFDANQANFGIIADHPELIDVNYGDAGGTGGGPGGGGGSGDWIHANAIDYNPDLDQIVISSRDFNEFWVIDHSTTTTEAASHSGGNSGKGGDILYRWGNPEVYDRGTAADQKLFGQHNVQWIPKGYPGEGNILIFNNGVGRPSGNYSTIDEIVPPMDMNGNYVIPTTGSIGPINTIWNYTASPTNSFYSNFISGTQRLPNGNTLVCSGADGEFFEVDTQGNMLWKYVNPVAQNGPVNQGTNPNNNSVFRAERYAPDFPGFNGLTLMGGNPIEGNPLPSACVLTNTKTIGTLEDVRLIQNPIIDYLNIENLTGEPLNLQLINLAGQVVVNSHYSNVNILENVNHLPQGMYILRLSNNNATRILTQKIIKL